MSMTDIVIFSLTLTAMLVFSYFVSGRQGLVGCSFGIALSMVIVTVLETLS